MTQAQVGKEFFGVGQQTIGRWENGDPPKWQQWGKVAKFLGLEHEDDVRRLLEYDSGNLSWLPGASAVTSEQQEDGRAALLAAYSERARTGPPLSEAEIDFVRELMGFPVR